MSDDRAIPQHTARDAAVKIVRALREAGFVAYLAGGCVRDALLGIEPKDYDVATDARPERVRELFRGARFVGEAFGVALVRLWGHDVEVATFRTEWGYEDGRRPTQVHFTDAEHDAQRRDFTINGLFEDPLAEDASSRIIDYVGGRADLEARLIRAIGEPDARFFEDHLRMLRAVRISARLGFPIEERTVRAIRAHARYLGQISRERIGMEIEQMLSVSSRGTAVQLIQSLRLDGPTLNEEHLDAPTPTVARLARDATYPAALTAWMLDRQLATLRTADPGGGQSPVERFADDVEALIEREGEVMLTRWRKALCLSNEQRDAVRAALTLLPAALHWPSLRVARRKRSLAAAGWDETLAVLSALGHRPGVEALGAKIAAESAVLLAEGVAPQPWVTGDDLIAMGRRPGPAFKQLLDEAYDAQLEGRVSSRDEMMAWLRTRE